MKIKKITNVGNPQVVLATWQSVYELPSEWFDQFEMVIVDEAHGAKSKSLIGIMEKLTNCDLRFGMTGTLDDIKIHKYVLEGLFGSVHKVITTKELIDQNRLADINIRCLLFDYSNETKKSIPKKYQDEIKFLISHKRRNNFIASLATSLPGNTLVLFMRVDAHGKILFELIKEKAKETTSVHFISGKIDADERNEIRKSMDQKGSNQILVASSGTTATGINIVHINNLILASPLKSKIRNLQSIGRGLRRGDGKEVFNLYDCADNLSSSKSWKNYTLKHFADRLRIYTEEGFQFTIKQINLEDPNGK